MGHVESDTCSISLSLLINKYMEYTLSTRFWFEMQVTTY